MNGMVLLEIPLICDECGSTEEVIESNVWWVDGEKFHGSLKLCGNCEEEGRLGMLDLCFSCNALLDGNSLILDEELQDIFCPECYEKEIREKIRDKRKLASKKRAILRKKRRGF